MRKVLIVDDEQFIREGIKTIIDWEKYGFDVCDTAVNGKEGLQKAEQFQPDLVIADIKMPVMDGLEMVGKMKLRGYDGGVIILTAHSDFGFAQRCIELGIDSYVLKPVEQADLIQKILKVKTCIECRDEAKNNMDDCLNLSREKILEGFVSGSIRDPLLEKYRKQYNLNFPWESYQVGLIDYGGECSSASKLKNEIKRSVEGFILEGSYGYVFDIGGYIGILFRNMPDTGVPRILMRLQDRISLASGFRVTISTGSSVDSLGLLPQSYLDARSLLEQKFLLGHKQIIRTEAGRVRAESGNDMLYRFDTEKILNDLQNAIDVNRAELINDLLEKMKDHFIRCRYDERVIKVNYAGLYLTLTNRIRSADEILKNCIPDSSEVLNEIGRKASLQELHGYVKLQLFSLAERLCCFRPENTIKRILDYIDRNYAKDIKLESLATMFSYNSTYLGKLFKSQTGMNFNTYLDHVRMEKAKQFLAEGFKVYQVVVKVGVCDIDYFYKKFKKYTGVSPSVFKGKN